MEEKKNAKVVNMNSDNNTDKKEAPKKLTYEQLNDACNQLFQQNKQLVQKVKELEQFCLNKRLECLFKIIENSAKFTETFVKACTDEIEDAMTIPDVSENKGE